MAVATDKVRPIESTSSADTQPIPYDKAFKIISELRTTLFLGLSNFESVSPATGFAGSKITAPSSKGHAHEPRPTSSIPTIRFKSLV